ncbi:hypothetical protein [Dubosiella newyorkensis]|uniref:hypothetical protein n=1 Tax=Dubosiella newyorkensis TaxID=1862672 RepID=UPI0023545F94|nr:hypothetical protein [Dubosiella newyorkensis]
MLGIFLPAPMSIPKNTFIPIVNDVSSPPYPIPKANASIKVVSFLEKTWIMSQRNSSLKIGVKTDKNTI